MSEMRKLHLQRLAAKQSEKKQEKPADSVLGKRNKIYE